MYAVSMNPAGLFSPDLDMQLAAISGDYAPGRGRMKSFNMGGVGNYWDGTFTDYQQ